MINQELVGLAQISQWLAENKVKFFFFIRELFIFSLTLQKRFYGRVALTCKFNLIPTRPFFFFFFFHLHAFPSTDTHRCSLTWCARFALASWRRQRALTAREKKTQARGKSLNAQFFRVFSLNLFFQLRWIFFFLGMLSAIFF